MRGGGGRKEAKKVEQVKGLGGRKRVCVDVLRSTQTTERKNLVH